MEAPPRFELGNKGFAELKRAFSAFRNQKLKMPMNAYIKPFVESVTTDSNKQ